MGIKWNIKKKGVRLAARLVAFVLGISLAAGAGHRLLSTDILVDAGFEDVHGFSQDWNYQCNGYLVASLMDIRSLRVMEPEGYSAEKAEKLLEDFKDSPAENIYGGARPHVIIVMNESLADLRVLGNLQISEETFPFLYSLRENTVRGYVNASVLGGGTANSEFEMFTGCSMAFLPASYYAYQQGISGPIPSLVSHMKEMGYTAYSIHPETGKNWSRDRVYQYFGFDHSIWKDDFQDTQTIRYGISDLDTYKKVEELFESRSEGEKLFIFDLTVQNHGGYTLSDVQKTVSAMNVSSEEADIFLSLMLESDRAFEQLVTYFERQEEPVLICMFGDHQPKFVDDAFYESIYEQTKGLEERDKVLNLYKTPFVIWANYDIEERDGLDVSMNYLGGLLMEAADFPCPPYFSFLMRQREDYPVITINGYQDKEGNHYNWSGDDSEFAEYRMLQYNYLFDSGTAGWGYEGDT